MIIQVALIILGIIAGFFIAWVIFRRRHEAAFSALAVEKGKAEERTTGFEKQLADARIDLGKLREDAAALRERAAKAEAENAGLKDRLSEQMVETAQLQQKFTAEFENLANKILEDKSKRFTEQNKVNLGELLNPLNERLREFQKRVEDTYDKESKQRFSLEGEIKKLYELNQQMSKDANNLTNALKGEAKTQGNWGEMILESVLEKSGLRKGQEFLVQESQTSDEGKLQKPDVVVMLPEDKSMVIDSKVSLTAYERYYATEDDKDRAAALKEHVASVRRHIAALSEKNYQNLYKINSPDFVLMFVPIEPAFALAVNADKELFYYAFEKNIVIVSPSTLLATLRTVASIWRQENQNRNALEIARQAGALYDKFVAFVEDMNDIGKKIDGVHTAHSDAMSKMSTGKGNLVRRADSIRQLGAKTSKTLPQQIVDKAVGDGPALIE